MDMKRITSSDNPTYKMLRTLASAKGRREHGLFIAEGPHLAEEALASRLRLVYLAVRDDLSGWYDGVLADGMKKGAEILLLPDRLFNALADTGTPQGILAVSQIARYFAEKLEHNDDTLAVVLDRVQDPGNAGTILRTALAVNAGFAVVTADSADPWSPKVVRASQGAVLHLPIVEADTAVEAIHALDENGWHTACGCMDGMDFFAREPHAKTAVVIGNEAVGVSVEAAAACSARYTLPMPGRAESLNAAVAAGIMLYDVWREQNQCKYSI